MDTYLHCYPLLLPSSPLPKVHHCTPPHLTLLRLYGFYCGWHGWSGSCTWLQPGDSCLGMTCHCRLPYPTTGTASGTHKIRNVLTGPPSPLSLYKQSTSALVAIPPTPTPVGRVVLGPWREGKEKAFSHSDQSLFSETHHHFRKRNLELK